MTLLLLLLSLFIATSLSLSDFRVTFQLSDLSTKSGDKSAVKTECVSKGANKYSDWAIGPSTGMKAMQIGLEKCSGSSIKDQDIRLCVQVGTEKKDGSVQCTDWASDANGGWSKFAQTVENEHIYKGRVMIETRSMAHLSFKDIEIGIQATDINAKKDANNPTLWGKPAWTGYLDLSGQYSVYTKSVYAHKQSAAIKGVKVYFEADTGVQYCCTLSYGKPRYYQTCAGDVRSQSKSQCEVASTINGPSNKCQWIDCKQVGYCVSKSESAETKRKCANHLSADKCGSGCEWKLGAMPEWYTLDFDYNGEEKMVNADNKLMAVKKTNVFAESEDIQWILIAFVALFLLVCGYGIYGAIFQNEQEMKGVINEYTPISQTIV